MGEEQDMRSKATRSVRRIGLKDEFYGDSKGISLMEFGMFKKKLSEFGICSNSSQIFAINR
jgi:hypothetical protein